MPTAVPATFRPEWLTLAACRPKHSWCQGGGRRVSWRRHGV